MDGMILFRPTTDVDVNDEGDTENEIPSCY